jgi:rhodanese-related sulfurtransferase
MGLRNFISAPRNVAGLPKKSTLSITSQSSQRRYISERPDGRGKIYEFEDVLSVLENPSDARLLIDVREPHEFGTDSIPTAINLPITSSPDALLLSPAEFQDQFGFAKPPIGKEMIFFCKAGVRSKAAAGIARQAGYTNVGEYPGSWNDWVKKGGPGTHSPPPPGGVGERESRVSETSFTGGKSSGELHEPEGVVKPPKGGMFGTQ